MRGISVSFTSGWRRRAAGSRYHSFAGGTECLWQDGKNAKICDTNIVVSVDRFMTVTRSETLIEHLLSPLRTDGDPPTTEPTLHAKDETRRRRG
jgi:hypothetical protein